MKNFSIVFMGTPEFAVTILDKLFEKGITIKAVVTAPDKPAGRGQKMHMSAVKECALKHDLPLLQPSNLKDEQFIKELRELNADMFVVVAFRMLPEIVWSMPPSGTINLHASLLPQYRGAAPINWAIINGEEKTGVTTFFIEKEIDTGKIIDKEEVQIGSNETVGELYERLMHLGAEVMLRTVKNIAAGNIHAIPQNEYDLSSLKPAPKIFREDCLIDFTKSAKEVHNFCRGLDPYPAAWCTLFDASRNETKTFKLFNVELTSSKVKETQQLESDNEGILFPCSDYYIRVRKIQPEGKRKMLHSEFKAGNSIESLAITV